MNLMGFIALVGIGIFLWKRMAGRFLFPFLALVSLALLLLPGPSSALVLLVVTLGAVCILSDILARRSRLKGGPR